MNHAGEQQQDEIKLRLLAALKDMGAIQTERHINGCDFLNHEEYVQLLLLPMFAKHGIVLSIRDEQVVQAGTQLPFSDEMIHALRSDPVVYAAYKTARVQGLDYVKALELMVVALVKVKDEMQRSFEAYVSSRVPGIVQAPVINNRIYIVAGSVQECEYYRDSQGLSRREAKFVAHASELDGVRGGRLVFVGNYRWRMDIDEFLYRARCAGMQIEYA